MKKTIFFSFLFGFFSYFIYGLFLSHYNLRIIPPELIPSHPDGFYDYAGVVHVQSKLSTGSGSPADVIEAAQSSGLDFLFFTDLNLSDPPKELSGYHNQLLVFIDGKYSYLNSRLLNLDVENTDHLQGVGRSQVVLTDLLNQENRDDRFGLFILAHPLKPRFQWSGEFPSGLDGIEIINLKQLWERAWEHNRLSFLWTLLIYPFNDHLSLLRLFEHPRAEIQLWDQMSQQRPTLGFSGADAESKIRLSENSYLQFPSYETLFSISRIHVLLRSELTGHAQGDRKKIGAALKNGNFYLSLDSLANPRGFNSYIKGPSGEVHMMGSQLEWTEDLKLHVQLPQKPVVPFDIEIFKNGKKLMGSNSPETIFPLHGPGVYRVQVSVKPFLPLPDGNRWFPWIYTNPFYVR